MALIDRDHLLQLVKKNAPFIYSILAPIAKLCPIIDAAPVLHASLKETGYDEAYCNWGDCTRCGTSNIMPSKYCNECGAKLDGGVEE